MNFKNIINRINKAFIVSGYSRAAIAMLQLSDNQLEDIGVSRDLLRQGYAAYPWRVEDETQTQAIPDNVSKLKDIKSTTVPANQTPIMPQTPKAA